MPTTRKWSGRWIKGVPCFTNGKAEDVRPAPYLRKTFEVSARPKKTIVYLCTAGWHELYLNGKKVDDRVLAPVVTQFDKHVSYIAYDVSKLVKKGKNAVAVLLGNGWYNCATQDVWEFVMAPWRDYPKMVCDIVADDALIAMSDDTWKVKTGPIVFDQLRNGEIYDARLEIPGFADPGLDDSDWKNAVRCNPPGGLIIEEELEPCKVSEKIKPVAVTPLSGEVSVYDFGANMTGWVEVTLERNPRGEDDQFCLLTHAEQVKWNGKLDQQNINSFVKSGACQQDKVYVSDKTVHQTRFSYHGFRYVEVELHGGVKLKKIEACFVHNSFERIGNFESSDSLLNQLQKMTVQSYLSNFTGIPTDCPHREKNGWTGDAQLALETGLWNFNGTKAYEHFLRLLADTQRPSGQLPGIAPTGGWGFNWGSGPAWDSLLFEGAWQLLRFRGDDSVMREQYDAMKRYLSYCESMEVDHLVDFGLGDWCHPDGSQMAPQKMTSSCYYYIDAKRFGEIAAMLGNGDDATYYAALAENIKKSINKNYFKNDSYANGEPTALAAGLYYGLCEGKTAKKVAEKLAKTVRERKHECFFGILGAKWVPRALSDYGYADDAFELITQTEKAGWGRWVKWGATSLWEDWSGIASLNHIMFGDISAWMYEYAAGVKPEMEHPGFRHFTIQPHFPRKLDAVKMSYTSPMGNIVSEWKRGKKGIECVFEIPEGASADVILSGTVRKNLTGKQKFTVE